MNKTKKLTISALLLATTLLLPFLTHLFPQVGKVFSPMHIPILICGFVCGWQYGLSIGLIAPMLSSVCFGMPPILPIGLSMSFELGTYGALAGLLYKYLPKKNINIYASLIMSMFVGRIVFGIAMFIIKSGNFTFNMYLTSAFITALPGIILHILVVPIVIVALKKAAYIFNGN